MPCFLVPALFQHSCSGDVDHGKVGPAGCDTLPTICLCYLVRVLVIFVPSALGITLSNLYPPRGTAVFVMHLLGTRYRLSRG